MFDLNEVIKAKAFDPSALHTVLFQEIERYNILLRSIREQCTQLEKGIQGLVAMSADLQIIFAAFSRAQVPAMWVKYAFYSIFYTHSSSSSCEVTHPNNYSNQSVFNNFRVLIISDVFFSNFFMLCPKKSLVLNYNKFLEPL